MLVGILHIISFYEQHCCWLAIVVLPLYIYIVNTQNKNDLPKRLAASKCQRQDLNLGLSNFVIFIGGLKAMWRGCQPSA